MIPEIFLAAALIHPQSDTFVEKFAALEIEPNRFYKTLADNRILLRVMRQADFTQSESGTIVRSFLARSPPLRSAHQRYLEIDEELFRLVDLFESHNIDVIFIKPVSYLPIDSDNYDILVRREELTRAFAALKREGFVHQRRCVEPDKYLFREVKRAKTFVAVHLHTRIAWDGVRFLEPEVAWKRHRIIRLHGRRVRFLSFDHNLLVTFAHLYFENHTFRLSDLGYAMEDMLSHQVNWDYVVEAARKANWESAFMDTLRLVRHTYVALFGRELLEEQDVMRLPIKANSGTNPMGNNALPQSLPVTKVFYNLMRKIWRDNFSIEKRLAISYLNVKLILHRRISSGPYNWGPYNKIVVSFSGPDKSGKTTHASLLCRSLGENGITAQYLWTRGGPFVSDRIWKSMRDSLGVTKHGNKIRASNLRQTRAAASYIYLINQFLRLQAGLLQGRGADVKVLDRNLRDTVVDVESEFEFTPSFRIVRCLEACLPKPSIQFLMGPSTSGIGPNALEHERYLAVMRDNKIMCVDTTGDIDENAGKILSLTLHEYYGT